MPAFFPLLRGQTTEVARRDLIKYQKALEKSAGGPGRVGGRRLGRGEGGGVHAETIVASLACLVVLRARCLPVYVTFFSIPGSGGRRGGGVRRKEIPFVQP